MAPARPAPDTCAMVYVSLQCWDDEGPRLVENAAAFASEEDALMAALELACNHQTVEMRHDGELLAYISRSHAGRYGVCGEYVH